MPALPVDNSDEPLPLRCHPGRTGERAVGEGVGGDGRHASGAAGKQFSIGFIFPLLHQQLYDQHMRQKVGTGYLNNLIIPDTIVFRVGYVGHPVWYLSSVSEPGVIKRKNSNNVTPRNVLEAFTKRKTKRSVHHAGSSGIIAVLVSDAHLNENITEQDQMGSATVEYLDEVLLRDFLERRAVKFNGLLQKWVDPKGQNNSMIHAIWTPQMCKVTCLTNVKSMSDRRSTMYERAVTFDGADSFTRRDPVSSTIHNHIVHVCSNFAKHVSTITDDECEIQRSTSYFKVRHDGKVVYMWSSSLRVNTDSSSKAPVQLATRTYSPVMGIPHSMDTKYDVQRERNYVCPVSNKVCSWNEAKTFITYKMIIQEWNAHYPADTAGQDTYRPSSARFRPSSAGTPRQVPPEVAYVRRTSSARTSEPSNESHVNRDDERSHALERSDALAAQQGDGSSRAVYAGRSSRVAHTKPEITAQNCVPELIRKLDKINDVQLYRRLLQDPTFLYKQVRVCSEVAQAYTKFASAHLEPAVGNREGLGHFLDDLPLNEHNRPLTNRPPSVRVSKEEGWSGASGLRTGVALSQADQPLSQADQPQQKPQQRQPLLPKVDLGGRWNGKADMGRESEQSQRDNQRQTLDVQQHKNRLAAAREKAQQHTANRYGPVSSTEKSKPPKPKTNTLGFNLFTDWKKECKKDDQRLESLKQRVAEQGSLTERVRPAPPSEEAAAVHPLSARPPNSVRSSNSGRPARQFSMAAAAIDPALANELAYHQGQAAMQKQFLENMIRDTKLRLNLGAADGSSRPPAADTHEDGGALQIQPFGRPDQQGNNQKDPFDHGDAEMTTVLLSPQDKLDQLQREAELEQEQSKKNDDGPTFEKHGQRSHPNDETSNEDSETEYEEEEEDDQDVLGAQAPRMETGRLRGLDNDQYAERVSSSSGFVQSEISSPRVDDMADEMLLAALHMATDQDPEKHRHALRGILPELESDEQKYFLNVITDLKGYNDDAALDAVF